MDALDVGTVPDDPGCGLGEQVFLKLGSLCCNIGRG